jgi:phosphate transport system substrate-binding protein
MKILNLAMLPLLCLSALQASAQAVIKTDGSSTVFPVAEALAEEFQTSQKGKIKVTVGISGTGGGFKKFCRGETDLQNASRPISAEEMEVCRTAGVKYYEIPLAFDALTVVVNPANTWAATMTVAELKKIWEPAAQGKITKWNQVRKEWPNETIRLYGAGSDSGTFDYFTEAIVGKAKASRGDYTGSEDDNTLVTGIAQDKFALGYLPYAYYEPNKKKLKVVAVDAGAAGPAKKPVLPSELSVSDGTYYPLSRPLFIYVSDASYTKKADVRSYVDFMFKNVASLALEVKYVPLPAKAYEMAAANIKAKKLGTAFKGHAEVGLRVEEILKREAAL